MFQITLLIWALLCGNPSQTNTGHNNNGTVTTMDDNGDIGGETGHVPPTPPPPPPKP